MIGTSTRHPMGSQKAAWKLPNICSRWTKDRFPQDLPLESIDTLGQASESWRPHLQSSHSLESDPWPQLCFTASLLHLGNGSLSPWTSEEGHKPLHGAAKGWRSSGSHEVIHQIHSHIPLKIPWPTRIPSKSPWILLISHWNQLNPRNSIVSPENFLKSPYLDINQDPSLQERSSKTATFSARCGGWEGQGLLAISCYII